MKRTMSVFVLLMVLPMMAMAVCTKHDATEVSALHIIKQGEVLWRSEPKLVAASVDDDKQSLCFVTGAEQGDKAFALLSIDSVNWLLEFESLQQLSLPLQLSVQLRPFLPRGVEADCANQTAVLTEAGLTGLKGCAAPLNGLSLRLMSAPLNDAEQAAAKQAKPFWQFEKANDKAKKRMKKM